MNDRIVELKDTKFSIEVEAIRLPDDVIASKVKDLAAGEKYFPYKLRTRVRVGDVQVGLVQSVQFVARAACETPYIAMDFNSHPDMSDRLKSVLEFVLQQVGQFPFIQCYVQGVPQHQYEAKLLVSKTVEELATQLENDLKGDKDWHDRAVDSAEAKAKAAAGKRG